jgi:lipid-A-disaccharide synthase
MEAAGMRCDFVGHPVVAEPVPTPGEVSAFRAAEGLGEAPVIVALPGSRRGEVERLAPVFGESLRPVLARHPAARVVVPAAAPVAGRVRELVRHWPGAPLVLDPRPMAAQAATARKRAAFAAAQVALAASGTVSLELAATSTPMVIAYDMNWLSRLIIGRMLKVDTVTLVNLVSESRAVPEFLGAACRAENIAPRLLEVMENPQPQKRAMAVAMQRLGRGGEAPGLRAARAVLAGLEQTGATG